jgi:hypothetical protein
MNQHLAAARTGFPLSARRAPSAALAVCATIVLAMTGLACTPAAVSPQPASTPLPANSPAPATSAATPGPTFTRAPAPLPTLPVAVAPTVPVPAGALAALAAVRQDLAQRLNLAEGQIALVHAEAVDWPNSSLGCPQPGMAYLQVITPGYRLVLAAGAVSAEFRAEYHTDAGGRFVSCAATP